MKFNTIFLSGMACSFGPFFAVAQQAAKPNVVVIMALLPSRRLNRMW